MRTYQEIWEELKRKGVCKLRHVHPRDRARLVKAVVKEKYMDVNYKFECSLVSKKVRLSYMLNKDREDEITFSLKVVKGLNEL